MSLPTTLRNASKTILACASAACLVVHCSAQSATRVVTSDGASWHIQGEGMVCCPCKVPCPCRSNGRPSYGHCEATLWLNIREGHYGSTDMSGMSLVEAGGMCAATFEHRSALYFDQTTSSTQREAYMKLVASQAPDHVAEFPYVRTVPIRSRAVGSSYSVAIAGILDLAVDRNWGLPVSPFSWVAATDALSNQIQYVQNIRYRIHDDAAKLNIDYSGRQANYRIVDLDQDRYTTKSMLIQFADGSGWFNAEQRRLIQSQNLPLPDLEHIRQQAQQLRQSERR